MIYYGDEVGMVGRQIPTAQGNDRGSKGAGPRDSRMVQTLIALCKERPVLRTGRCRVFLADSAQNLLGYARFSNEDQVLVVINNSDSPREIEPASLPWPLFAPGQVNDLLTGRAILSREPWYCRPRAW